MHIMKEKAVFLATQFRIFSRQPEDFGISADSVTGRKFTIARRNMDEMWQRAKKIGVKQAFSTDCFGSMKMQAQQSLEFTARAKYFTPYEILVQATSAAAELLAYCGKLHPYQEGPLGVLKEGAYADMLIVDGNPLKDISLLADPDKNLKLIMKDGKIYKYTL